ncbi:MAG: hypothetical protein M1114_04530 [Candidatus Dependentiae bacterium]|nr:hypothetical protein [Candidatus Dependentiae bacterium]
MKKYMILFVFCLYNVSYPMSLLFRPAVRSSQKQVCFNRKMRTLSGRQHEFLKQQLDDLETRLEHEEKMIKLMESDLEYFTKKVATFWSWDGEIDNKLTLISVSLSHVAAYDRKLRIEKEIFDINLKLRE